MQWHQLGHMQTICTLLQTDNHTNTHHSIFTGQMHLQTPNEQYQRTKGQYKTSLHQTARHLWNKTRCISMVGLWINSTSDTYCFSGSLSSDYLVTIIMWCVISIKRWLIGTGVCVVHLNVCLLPSVLWHCWLGSRKGIRPAKNWVVGCWHGYLSGARCRLAYSPADATATHCLLLQ